MKVTVYLKGGGQFTTDCQTVTTNRNRITGELEAINFEGIKNDRTPKMNYLNLEAVEAVVTEDRG